MKTELRFDEDAVCERCGRYGAFEFEGQRLCADCYQTQGSCCPEFGNEDLWEAEP